MCGDRKVSNKLKLDMGVTKKERLKIQKWWSEAAISKQDKQHNGQNKKDK